MTGQYPARLCKELRVDYRNNIQVVKRKYERKSKIKNPYLFHMVKRFPANILRTSFFVPLSLIREKIDPQGCVVGKFTSQWDDKRPRLGIATPEPMTIFLPCSQDEKGSSRLPDLEDLLLRNPDHPFQRRRTTSAQGHDAELRDIFYDGIDVTTDMQRQP